MSELKLSPAQLDKLMSGLIDDSVDTADSFARAVWSLITEPGDTFATALISTLGAKQALSAELNRITSKQYVRLIKEAGFTDTAGDRFKNLDSLLVDARERWQPRIKLSAAEQMLSVAKSCKAKLLTPKSSLWPEQLEDLNLGTPHGIWLRGNLETLAHTNRSMAVVGARQATSYGEWVTTEIVSAAAAENIAIVSGGAYGIDAVSHRSALATDTKTIAIMAGGVDRLYPSGNTELLTRIIQNGAVISEQAPGSNPTPACGARLGHYRGRGRQAIWSAKHRAPRGGLTSAARGSTRADWLPGFPRMPQPNSRKQWFTAHLGSGCSDFGDGKIATGTIR